MDDVFYKEQQEIAETPHEPRDTNPIILDTSNDEGVEGEENMIEDIETREPEQTKRDEKRRQVKSTRRSICMAKPVKMINTQLEKS